MELAPWFAAPHDSACGSQDRLLDPGPEGEGVFDERGWYHPPCDCGAASSNSGDTALPGAHSPVGSGA